MKVGRKAKFYCAVCCGCNQVNYGLKNCQSYNNGNNLPPACKYVWEELGKRSGFKTLKKQLADTALYNFIERLTFYFAVESYSSYAQLPMYAMHGLRYIFY